MVAQGTMCECEHVQHFDDGSKHKFGLVVEHVQQIRTPHGIYTVCDDCAGDCLAEHAEQDLIPLLTKSLHNVTPRGDNA